MISTLCCQAKSSDVKNKIHWKRVNSADFETDVTMPPHRPYIYCVFDIKIRRVTSDAKNEIIKLSRLIFHKLNLIICSVFDSI